MERKMTREQLLAAEIYSYSYANYHDHLGVNERYDRIMPQTVATLERAEREKWKPQKIAENLGIGVDDAQDLMEGLKEARAVVDAENPAEAFRNGVRQSIEYAIKEGLTEPDDIEKLVVQVCYRASDLAYLLMLDGQPLSRYSRHLRKESDVGYYDGYFDEDEFA
jgi:hypothetical protein